MSALTTVIGKSLYDIRVFYVTIADADIESLKSLQTLFDDRMLVQFKQKSYFLEH